MIKYWRYVLRNVARNPVRTALTVLGVAVAIFVITYLFTIFDSRRQAVSGEAGTILVVQEKDIYWPTQSAMPGDVGMARRLESDVAGVVGATPIYIKMNKWASSGGGLVKIVGIEKEDLRDYVEMDVDPEAWDAFLGRRNAALLGTDIVNKFQDQYVWKEGEEFAMADFEGLTLYMAGVFTPRNPAYRNVIIADRVFLQEVDDARGLAHQFFVRVGERADAAAISSAIDGLDFPVDLNAEPAQTALDQALDDLDDMLLYARYVVLFTALTIFLCITNTVSMSIYDRTQELGVLRSLGFERGRILRMVLSESVLVCLLGGILGCAAAYVVLELSPQSLSTKGITVPLIMRPAMLGLGIAAAAAVGLVGGLMPAFRAARLDIVASLRNVE